MRVALRPPASFAVAVSSLAWVTLASPALADGLDHVESVVEVSQLTGAASPNATDQVNVYGTDLGNMFVHDDGRLYFLFGDTFGSPGTPETSGDWRSNVMAFTSDFTASDGITLDGWIVDGSGHAKALVEGEHHPNDGSGEVTKIPTSGFSVGGRQHMWFMSVRQWGAPGQWICDYAEIATSDDDGSTWTRSGVQWAGDGNFVQTAVVEHEGWLYVYGIPAGRFGSVRLARVAPGSVLDQGAYEYYAAGSSWTGVESDAVDIVPSPAGELSVAWNGYLNRWMMLYLDEGQARIVLREATDPWGPWSEGVELCNGADYPALYGPFTHPVLFEEDGRVVHFLLSRWGAYNVFVMKAVLARVESTTPDAGPQPDAGGQSDAAGQPDASTGADANPVPGASAVGGDEGSGCACRSAGPGGRGTMFLWSLLGIGWVAFRNLRSPRKTKRQLRDNASGHSLLD